MYIRLRLEKEGSESSSFCNLDAGHTLFPEMPYRAKVVNFDNCFEDYESDAVPIEEFTFENEQELYTWIQKLYDDKTLSGYKVKQFKIVGDDGRALDVDWLNGLDLPEEK